MMNGSPAIVILNASALPLARTIKQNLRQDGTIYALAGKIADYPHEFIKLADFVQVIYQQNKPIIAICASGIIIRALAPILEHSPHRPPVLSVAIDGSHIVPLLGVTSGANRLARQIALSLNASAAVTTAGELRFGINLLDPPPDLKLLNQEHGKKFISYLLDGAGVRLTGVSHDWLCAARLPIDETGDLHIHIAGADDKVEGKPNKLVYRRTIHINKELQHVSKDLGEEKTLLNGRINIIGLGPGHDQQRTLAVNAALRQADDIFGYGFYVDQAGPFQSRQKLHRSDNGRELDRARQALVLAAQGRNVALVSSGDAGVFGMAAAFFEILEEISGDDLEQFLKSVKRFSDKNCGKNKQLEHLVEPNETKNSLAVEIVVEPGITAALAASSRFGAPLGGDFAIISLSDNLKSQSLIEKRLRLAAQADMALALYNPVSKARPHQIERILSILMEEKSPDTPIGLATDIGRKGEKTLLTTLSKVQFMDISSRTVILVGSSKSRIFHACGRQWFYTPRSYKEEYSRA